MSRRQLDAMVTSLFNFQCVVLELEPRALDRLSTSTRHSGGPIVK